MNLNEIKPLIKKALEEDVGKGDVTSNLVISKKLEAKAVIYVREKGVICGLDVAKLVFNSLDKKIKFEKLVKDGGEVKANQPIASVEGNAREILKGERVALNFLQHLSGIATLTSKYVNLVKPYKVKILDTRKTTPGLKLLEKYAVCMGKGHNHRFGLYDGILVKNNHVRLIDVKKAIKLAKKSGKKVEVEVVNLKQVKEALEAKADIIMLDNMNLKDIKKAVKMINKKAIIEASGGVNLNNVVAIAKTGVDWISVGRLTHSANALNMNLEIE